MSAEVEMGSKTQDPVWVRALNVASYIALVSIALLFLGIAVHLATVANPPATATIPLFVDKEEYLPGDNIAITAKDFCRNTDAPAESYVSYVDTVSMRTYFVGVQPATSFNEGCVPEATLVETVPLVPPSEYFRRSRVVYYLGLGFTREVEFETETFTVLPLE